MSNFDIVSYFENEDLFSNNIIWNLYKYSQGNLNFTNNKRYDLIAKNTLGRSESLGYILLTEDQEHYYVIS